MGTPFNRLASLCPIRAARRAALFIAFGFLIAACGGGSGGANDQPTTPVAVDAGPTFQFTDDNAQRAVVTTLGLIQHGAGQGDLVVAAAQHFATVGLRDFELLCRGTLSRLGTVSLTDRDGNQRISRGDAFEIDMDLDACEVDASGGAENRFEVTAYAADEIGVIDLSGGLSLSSTSAIGNAPVTNTEGLLNLAYSSPESFSLLELTDMELTITADDVDLRLTGGRQVLRTDLASQTDTARFSGRVEDEASDAVYQFDTPVDFRRDSSDLPTTGQLVLDGRASRTRIQTLEDPRRRAYVGLAVDLEGNGRYGTDREVRWDELIRRPEQLFRPFLVGRGFFIRPMWPLTNESLLTAGRISPGELPAARHRFSWYRNGQRIDTGIFTNQAHENLTTKGDFFEVRLSFDGAPDATRIASATIQNSPPLLSIEISPEGPDSEDDISVVATIADLDHDTIITTYEWEVNGMLLPDIVTATLPKDRHVRGDAVKVTVTVDDGAAIREESLALTIADAEPRAVASDAPETVGHGERVEFEVSVMDPDGDIVDPGSLRIGFGPPGMTIDPETGLVTWRPDLPMFDRTLDVHWQVTSANEAVAPIGGTITVVDESRRYPLMRTDLQSQEDRFRWLQVGDLNGDGDDEMLVLGHRGTPHILEWNGEDYMQTWAYPFPIGDSGGARAVAHGDIDHDGHHEIFISSQDELVRLDGVERRQAVSIAAPEGLICTDLAVEDLNGDGTSELVCIANEPGFDGGSIESRLLVFGAEDLNLTWESDPILGASMAIGNVDRDNALEIVTNGGYVFDGATFRLEWQHDERFDDTGKVVSLGDIDGDGVDEIVCQGVFSALSRQRLTLQGLRYGGSNEWFFAADVVGDTRAEILKRRSGGISVYQIRGPSGPAVLAYEVSVPGGFVTMASGDLDGDGRTEFVVAGSNYTVIEPAIGVGVEWRRAAPRVSYHGGIPNLDSTPLRLMFISGSGSLVQLPVVEAGNQVGTAGSYVTRGPAIGAGGIVRDVLATDLDGDGTSEPVVALYSSGSSARLIEGGIHLFEPALNEWSHITQLAHPGARNLHSLARADVGGDGVSDLLAAGESHSTPHAVAFDLVNDTVLFRTPEGHDARFGEALDIAGADLDGDGRAEIIVATDIQAEEGRCKDLLFVYARKQGESEFSPAERPVDTCHIVDLVVHDFDGDDRPEMVFVNDLHGRKWISRFNTDFERINYFEVFPETDTVRIFPPVDTGACTDCPIDAAEARTLLVAANKRLEDGVVTRLAAFDITNGGMIWQSPWLIGGIRDVYYVAQGPRWAIATTRAMYVTR